MTARPWMLLVPLGALGVACGDVTADLVVDPRSDASAEGSRAGVAGAGGSPSTAGAGGTGGAAGGTWPQPSPSLDGGAECASNEDCPACVDGECQSFDRDLCDTVRGRCVECVNDGHCDTADERCSAALGRCVKPCTGRAVCELDELCDTVVGFCVECVVDGDCAEPGQVCRRSECTM